MRAVEVIPGRPPDCLIDGPLLARNRRHVGWTIAGAHGSGVEWRWLVFPAIPSTPRLTGNQLKVRATCEALDPPVNLVRFSTVLTARRNHEGYFVDFCRWCLTLPRWATPGTLTVRHIEVEGGWFVFAMEIVHPWLGMLGRESLF
jgi:uncharacterized protein DUF4166